MPKDPRETAAELISRFSYADSWRKQFDERAIECYKLYIGYRDELPQKQAGRSNLHIPRTYEQIDTWRARLVKAFFGTSRPWIDFLPMPGRGATPEAMVANDTKAQLAAALVDMQLEQNCIVRRFYDFTTSFLVFPAAILGVGWRFERRTVKRKMPVLVPTGAIRLDGTPDFTVELQVQDVDAVTWDDNELVNVDYFDFWPDPRGTDIDSCRFAFQREWATQEQAEAQLALLEDAGTGEVYPVDWDALRGASGSLPQGNHDMLTAVGLAPETSDGYYRQEDEEQEEQEERRRGNLFELLHYWEDGRHAILVNRTELAYDGANPYWRHGKKPFVAVSFEPLPGQFYGMSAVQVIEHLQHELNTLRNQRIDNVSLVLNRMWKVKRSADIEESELVSRPHGVIHVDATDDVTDFPVQDVTASAYNDEAVTKQDMENALGTPGVVRGVNPTRKETATATATLAGNASIRFDAKIALFDSLGLRRMAYLMDCNNQQFIDQPRLVRLFGEQGPNQWRPVQPGEIIGEFDYRPAGANTDPAANKELRRQQLSQALAFAVQTNNPFIKKYELTREWLNSFDFRNVDKFMYTEQKVMQMQAAAEAQAAQQQAMAALARQAATPAQQAGGPNAQPPAPEALPPGIA